MPNQNLPIAHRGVCVGVPENTRAAFSKALEAGVAGIEFDIQLSKDKEPVVIHDDTLERTTNGRGRVSDYSFWELQQFDAGGGERIPHLSDIFTLVDRRCHLFIELKTDAVASVEAIIREQIEAGWSYAELWTLAFDHALLTKMHALNSHIQLCASFEHRPDSLAALHHSTHATAIAPSFAITDSALVKEAHTLGLQIFPWTANAPADIARIKTLGVSGIISDFPERINAS